MFLLYSGKLVCLQLIDSVIKFRTLAPFWCLYCQLGTYFTPCSRVFIVNFEQVNADWDCCDHYNQKHIAKIIMTFDI